MKRHFIYPAIVAAFALLGGCTTTYYASSSGYQDDLYTTHDTRVIARAAAEQQQRDYERAQAAAQAAARVQNNQFKSTDSSDQDVLSQTYDESYERRLQGFDSPTYKMPSSYYNFRYSSESNYVSAYDPAFYNVIVMGDQIWVEPRYITAMFGAWDFPSRFDIAWSGYWGWNYPWYYTPGWGSYWGCWGSPYYSNWGWNFGWNNCYNNYWGYPNYWDYGYCPPRHDCYSGGGGRYYPDNVVHRQNYRTGSFRQDGGNRGSYASRGIPASGAPREFRTTHPSSGNQSYRPGMGQASGWGTSSGNNNRGTVVNPSRMDNNTGNSDRSSSGNASRRPQRPSTPSNDSGWGRSSSSSGSSGSTYTPGRSENSSPGGSYTPSSSGSSSSGSSSSGSSGGSHGRR